jgi:hypothetical protein
MIFYFLFICFRATKNLRRDLGWLASVIFVWGLLSFVNKDNESETTNSTRKIKEWNFNSPKDIKGYQRLTVLTIEDELAYGLDLDVKFAKDSSQVSFPLSAGSSFSGLSAGNIWQPENITLNPTNTPNSFKYSVSGIMKWRLLGSTIYHETRLYQGFIELR